jgi:hypothetical protein
MPNGRKPGERAAGVPRRPRVPYTPEQKEARRIKRDEKKAARPAGWLPQPDGQVHVPTIGSADPEILPRKLKTALEYYYVQDRSHRNKAIETAAELADMNPAELRMLLSQPAVQEIIQRRLDRIEFCKAAYAAKSQVLSLHFLDTNLVTAVKVAAMDGDSKPLELAYERLGVRRDKNFMTTEQASPQSRPQIYRVLEQTVIRTEQVTQRQITTEAPSSAGLLPSAANSNVEVMDY